MSVFLNISKDHKPVTEIARLFKELAAGSKKIIINADDPSLSFLMPAITFGQSCESSFHPDYIDSVAPFVCFRRSGVEFRLPLPGRYNLSNALAALCVCNYLGCKDVQCAEALRSYKGVKRRFNIVKLESDLIVIDDFAHNPEKVKAAITTAQSLCKRVLAIFQPHGFGPTRFLKDDFVLAFSETLRKNDELFLLPIYYAGGTTLKDISSEDLAELVRMRSRSAWTPADRPECLAMIREKAAPGDAILLMGARDPSLSSFARKIVETLQPA
jgi:UDP-N-acetylmuramate--alanine ligase